MNQPGIVTVHIAPALQRDAEQTLSRLGITPEEAITRFYRQLAENPQITIDTWVEVPMSDNRTPGAKSLTADTLQAIKDLKRGRGARYADFAEWLASYQDERPDEPQGKGQRANP